MGFTAVEGLIMSTRCGSIDPGVILYLESQGMSLKEVETLIYKQSGLLGISGLSGDMRQLLASDDPRARLAVDMFCYRVRKTVAAYAGASLANADPFKTGNTAFRLGLAKALVPFVFVFSPSLLIVAKGFTPEDFTVTFIGCVLGITLLAAVLSKYFLVEMTRTEQLLCLVAALLMIAPGLLPTLAGAALAVPMVARQVTAWRRVAAA